MIKNGIPLIFGVFLFCAFTLNVPQLADSYETIDNCTLCHETDNLHVKPGHSNCTQCHATDDSGIIRFTTEPAVCIVCHPLSGPGTCNLVGTHGGIECLSCHGVDCPDITTTTSVPVEHEKSGKVNETLCLNCHEMGNPISPSGGTLHGEHSDCDQCHVGENKRGTVTADRCMECHPAGKEGTCNLAAADVHGSACIDCHSYDCPNISTTTTVPKEHENGGMVNDTLCLNCHEMGSPVFPSDGTLHGDHSDCDRCHVGERKRGTVTADKCVECHPAGNEGTCNLAALAEHGSDCTSCHSYNCPDITTTTTVPKEHVDGGVVNETLCLLCHEMGSPINPSDGTLHGNHSDCDRCHVGGKKRGTVTADKCVECHPAGIEGTCNLAGLAEHGNNCISCHSYDCPDITTTSSVPGNHWEDGAVNETVCLLCHEMGNPISPSDGTLHGNHSDCDQCHVGGKKRGTVTAGKCVVCHPSEDPGKCSLADLHGSSCLDCHSDCADGTTTTTTPKEHWDGGAVNEKLCLLCHGKLGDPFTAPAGTLHGNHDKCAQCHEGLPENGTVTADKCIECHLPDDPGLCSLVNEHGENCLKCHSNCEVVITTTTTTMQIPLPSLVVTPGTLLRSRWIMLPALMFIEGDDTAFALFCSNPVYEPAGAVFPLPALVLGPEFMVQPVFVNPAWLAGTDETQTVTVTVDEAFDTIEINMLAEPFDRLNSF